MTREEFLKKLNLAPANWKLFDDGRQIRNTYARSLHCPITAVCELATQQIFYPSRWSEAANAIGLSYGDAYAITLAADATPDKPYDHDLRQALLAATRLT